MRRSIESIAVAAALLFGLNTLAAAQNDAARGIYESSATVPTNIAGVHTFHNPPANFNPLTESDEALATFGFPPRPNKEADPDNYAKWARAMSRPLTRVHEDLKDMGIQSTAMVQAKMKEQARGISAAPSTGTSSNWSGVVNTNRNTAWNAKSSFYFVVSDFNVPVVQQAFGGVCDGGWDLEVSWNGIDGFSNGDVLQGGSLSGAYCNAGTKSTSYYAWIEWYPSYSILFAFNVNPGDDMFVETWDTSPTNGYVYLADLTLGISGTYNLVPTTTPYLIGNSAEYIVERPCCRSGNGYPLANYVQNFWMNDYADTFKYAQSYAGSQSPSTWLLSMVDDLGTQVISYPEAGSGGTEGKYGIFFQDANCAYYGGCTP